MYNQNNREGTGLIDQVHDKWPEIAQRTIEFFPGGMQVKLSDYFVSSLRKKIPEALERITPNQIPIALVS